MRMREVHLGPSSIHGHAYDVELWKRWLAPELLVAADLTVGVDQEQLSLVAVLGRVARAIKSE